MNTTPETVETPADAANTAWQSVMDTAYAKFTDDVKGYAAFLETLTETEITAVLLGNLNGQVCNGGFQQWVDNGYALHGSDVIQELFVLRKLFANPAEALVIDELRAKIRALLECVNTKAKNVGFAGDYWKRPNRGEKLARSMDDWYYETAQPVLESVMVKFLTDAQ